MRRPGLVILSLAIIAGTAGVAAAEVQVVVVGPAAEGKLAGEPALVIAKTLADAKAVTVKRAIDVACAADVECLTAIGVEAGAHHIVSITIVKAAGKKLDLLLVAVDVDGKVLMARREITVAEKTLPRGLTSQFKLFYDDAKTERAKALFAKGNQHYNLGEFAIALEVYKQAYTAKQLGAFLFNIAQCHRKLGDYQEAVTMYQSYLGAVPDAPNKQLVESLIAESRAKLAEGEQRAKDDAAAAAAKLAAEQAKAEEVRKAHEAEALTAAERRKTEQARIDAEAAKRRDEDQRYDRHPARRWAYVGAAIGLVAAGTGGYFGLQSRSAQASYDDRGCGDPAQLLDADELAACRDDRDTGKRAATISNSLLISGGAVIAVSAVLFILDPGNVERPRAGAQLQLSPTGVQVMVRW